MNLCSREGYFVALENFDTIFMYIDPRIFKMNLLILYVNVIFFINFQDEFALNTYKILSLCHESQSGALVFLICRIIGKLEPAIAVRYNLVFFSY